MLQEKGINIETTKIGKDTSEGIEKIYMKFTSNLTPDEVDSVKNKTDSLESSVSCVIYESPHLFQIELGKEFFQAP